MDAEFLKQHVGDALKKGMGAVNLYQPTDPVAYLGQYLIKYVENAEQDARVRGATPQGRSKGAAVVPSLWDCLKKSILIVPPKMPSNGTAIR